MNIDLGEVARLANALMSAEDDVESAEAALKVLKERERKLREEDLPAAMEEVGLKKFTLENGAALSVGFEVYCAFTKAQQPAVFTWLTENGHGGLIKTELSARFGRSDDDKEMLAKVAEAMEEVGVQPEASESVHAQTMKAFLKEQLSDPERAKGFPLDLFGARPVNVAKVKRPKML